MKEKIKITVTFFIAAFFLTILSSCEKEEEAPCNQGGTLQATQEQTN